MATICPLDSRYREIAHPITDYISDKLYYLTRLKVELYYLTILLKKKPDMPQIVPSFDFEKDGDEIYIEIRNIEETTKHDVKSIEYYLRQQMMLINPSAINLVHCGLTSQDTNSVATTVMLKNAGRYMTELFNTFNRVFNKFIVDTRDCKIMTYTHGQPAVCSTLGWELLKFDAKINESFKFFNEAISDLTCKFSGSIGNYTTFSIMFSPDEIKKLHEDMRKLLNTDLIFSRYSRQIDNYHSYMRLLQVCQIIAIDIGELADNLWLRITRREIVMTSVSGEIGSSVMAHKINPYRLEQVRATSNFISGECNTIVTTIGCSRDSRDMSDSFALRFLGVMFAKMAVMFDSIQTDISRLKYNEEECHKIIENNLVSLSEYFQTYLRWHCPEISDPYKLLEALTKGKTLTYEQLHHFVDELKLPSVHAEYLKSLKADTVFGFDLSHETDDD
jgi:adenylosuccinate lyase